MLYIYILFRCSSSCHSHSMQPSPHVHNPKHVATKTRHDQASTASAQQSQYLRRGVKNHQEGLTFKLFYIYRLLCSCHACAPIRTTKQHGTETMFLSWPMVHVQCRLLAMGHRPAIMQHALIAYQVPGIQGYSELNFDTQHDNESCEYISIYRCSL